MKVLLVDDEIHIRTGLKTLIQWTDLECELVGEASDGVMAYELIHELEPDICIIDIKMPEMDGIEVIEKLFEEKWSRTHFIILSGFGEFDYAKRAMKCHVNHYVLKPIDEDILVAKIKDIQQELKNEISVLDLLVQREIRHIVTEKVELYLVNQEVRRILQLPWKMYQVVCVQSVHGNVSKEAFETTIQRFFHTNAYCIQVDASLVVLLKNQIFDKTVLHLENFKKELEKSLKCAVCITLGKPISTFDRILESYQDAKLLMEYRFKYSQEHIITFHQLRTEKEVFESIDITTFIENITRAIYLNQMEQINDLMEELFEVMRCMGWEQSYILSMYVHLYSRIVVPIINRYPKLSQEDYLDDSVIQSIVEQVDLRRLHGFIKYNIISLAETIGAEGSKEMTEVIKKYIEENYFEEIRIEDLAKMFNYNSGYLGKQFKDKTGVAITQYVDEVRMNQSKQLLKTTELKIYEIARHIGYNDPDYFATKFKKLVGLSPNQYRNS